MAFGAKRKGSTFERLVAELILRNAGRGFGKKDCYRTPMSGGHPFAGSSDLVISKELQRFVPWCIECKHYKSWKVDHFFQPTQQIIGWAEQVTRASRHDKFKRAPLLVVRGNATVIYAAAPKGALRMWSSRLMIAKHPALLFYVHDTLWQAMPFSEILKSIKLKAKAARESR